MTRRTQLVAVAIGLLVIALAFGALGCAGGEAENGNGTEEPENVTPAEPEEPAVELRIQAAASLTDALNDVAAAYRKDNPNVTLTINYGSSGNLQTQIEQGAPADIFLSAAKKNVDALEESGLLLEGSRRNFATNSLVVVVPKGNPLGIAALEDLTGAAVKVVALGDPESVPAGKYGKQSLEAVGVYGAIQAKTVLGKDVRAVLTYVETGDADAGIVYKTDALISTAVDVAVEIDDASHDPIVYPGAVVGASTEPEAAAAFLDYLSSAEAASIFEQYGFGAAE